MKLNRKLWTAALAVAMTTPSAMAAQDTAGMHYTSAAEGFYASIRARYVSNGGDKDGGSDIQNSSSRFGVRGTNDLGSGLEGFYQYEMLVNTDQGEGVGTRLGLVGLRGDFGEVVAGSFWTNTYNWVDGSTDIANRSSGNFAYDGHFGQARSKKSFQYTTPDLNGFQGAFLIKMDSSSDGEGGVGGSSDRVSSFSRNVSVTIGGRSGVLVIPQFTSKENVKDDSDIDHWSLAAKYEIAGFSMGFSYANNPKAGASYAKKLNGSVAKRRDAEIQSALDSGLTDVVASHGTYTSKDDMPSWAVKLGYSQDNWYVNSWYGVVGIDGQGSEIDLSGMRGTVFVEETVKISPDDIEVFSIAGGISVDKVAVYAVYENMEHDNVGGAYRRVDDSYHTLGLQYTLGSNSWTWVEYAGRDLDSSENEDGDFSIGLGHSF
jgi:predicted porin